MVTLPPMCLISIRPMDDEQNFSYSPLSPCRYSHVLLERSGMPSMRNATDLDDFIQLPRIRGPDLIQSLPSLRELRIGQLDKYRRPLQSPSDRQDPEGTSKDPRMSFGSGDSAGRKDVRERGEDVDKWVRSASYHAPRSPSRSQGSLSPRSSTPKRASDSQDLFDADVDLAHPADVHRGLSPPSYRQESAQDNRNQQVVPRTRIHNFLVEAGGLGIALSEESMRKLRYVLQWLQYATNRIDQQILAIRDFTESLQQNYFYPPVTTSTPGGSMHHHSRSSSGSFSSESQAQAISSAHMRKLTSLRRDVVQTVRQVVNIVSKHGGGAALPEPAQNAMKGFILKLPKRVKEAMRMGAPPSDTSAGMGAAAATAGASTNIGGVNGNEKDSITAAASGRARSERRSGASRRTRLDRGVGGSLSATQSPASSTTNSPAHSPRMFSSRSLRSFTDDDQSSSSSSRHAASQQTMSAGMAVVAAQRILTLATESLDMMHGVTGIVKDSLDRADAWVEKLKIVGIQRGNGPSESQPVTSLDSGSDNHGLDLPPSALPDRDQDSDSALLSPLSMSLSLGRSRRGSIGNNLGSSVPSTPGFSGYPGLYQSSGNTPFYDTHVLPVDAPSPEVGLGMRRMSIRGDDDIIKKELEEAKMEVDEVTFGKRLH
ncbi:hypothetical protein D9757_001204 [Collybiopsis confluens]|uniref:Opi1-domain-containing protein n=1 Tax=Collybiopsis confluens TaxID=2823264 RepID=A0A8H5I140_9AGAR|nr:hypothetical protein D9757_001204 [Collybiopsis confluens]